MRDLWIRERGEFDMSELDDKLSFLTLMKGGQY